MDLDALRFADFTLLDAAVEDWTTMVHDLDGLRKSADRGLKGAAEKADWGGYNATVSKEFILKTAGEFSDAHTQATSIRNVLRDTCAELRAHQKQLTEAIERGRRKNLAVVPAGDGGFTVTMNVHPDRAPAGTTVPDHDEADVTSLRDEVQRILGAATHSDESAKEVLQALVDQSHLGFSDTAYRDRDAGARALKEADELARLARRDPGDLTVEEFDRLSAGLGRYGHDGVFAERFATDLGPRGTLAFWTGITDPGRCHHLSRERLDRFDELQRNLSLTLASASQSDSAAMAGWKHDMIGLGETRIGNHGSGPTGFQVMSNLMRVGDYDDRFMKDYGTRLMATERKLTDNGAHPNLTWQFGAAGGPHQFLNHIGGDSGADPLTGYLKGLSNSPDAATDFFNQQYVSKDDQANPFERDTDGNGRKGKVSLSNFQYLFEERDWPQEVNSHGEALHTGQNNMALALEAATTGHPAGELPTMDTPAHDEGRTKLFESIVSSVSDDGERLTKNGFMSDSMGQIASEYLPDINRALADVDEPSAHSSVDEQEAWDRTRKQYPIAGSFAQMNHRDVARFLFAIGQNPEGYAAVEVGQQSYMSKLMYHHLDPGLPENQRPNHDLELTVRSIARHSGEVSGTLAMGRNQAIAGPAAEKDDHYDHAVSQWKNALSGGIGTGIGVGTSFIATPAVGAGVGGAAGTVTSMVLEELFQDAEGSAKDDAGATMGANWEAGQEANMKYTRRAASEAARAHRLPHSGDIATWAEDESYSSYLDAGDYMERVGPELLTDI
ncbi:hypothetical protein GCM10018793_22210 [Streptomyces sulfonofaciens]|uniref:AG2 protein n=1 Tax=Streptomyces sulfonofaciens TaxID=68272 RepID=A0A919KYM3_9ACTN|nr:hypothetical protein [Streptomyces sulfonofaciens]GHH76466.1 hypothetical protein GCM10018793_22210 [Streptomyces sulfonofaciens]